MSRTSWFLVPAAAFLVSSTALADENEVEPHACPFPEAPSDAVSRPSSAEDPDVDPNASSDVLSIAGALIDAFVEGGSQPSTSYGSGANALGTGGTFEAWPDELGIHLDGAYASLDLSTLAFSDLLDTFAVTGSSVRLGQLDLAGGELGFELALDPRFRVGAGAGIFGPIAGDAGGDFGPGRFGRSASSGGLLTLTGYVEALYAMRFGPISAFAGVRTGIVHSEVRIDSSCGCNGILESTRVVLGPRVGLRTRLFRSVFVQASLFADATHLPDYIASVGIGVGNRGR